MPATVVHAMNTPWTSSGPALSVTADAEGNHLSAPAGALGAAATFTPAAPLDLTAFDELRFRIRADRPADGSLAAPFWLELSYRDAGDLPNEEHRWFVPVNAAGVWEQRRIGIAGDRRGAVDRLRFTALDDRSFSIAVDELLAVDERMLEDLESALSAHISASLTAPLPVVFEAPPTPANAPVPSIIVTPLGVTEDTGRTHHGGQRDSFRPRAAGVVCSIRAGARAYVSDYQIAAVAADRAQQAAITDRLATRLSTDVPLRVNGALWPVWVMPALPLLNRAFGTLAPSIYIRVGARAEIEPRVEAPWVRRVNVGAARPDSAADTEQIAIQL